MQTENNKKETSGINFLHLLKNGWLFIALLLIIGYNSFGNIYSSRYPPVVDFNVDYGRSHLVKSFYIDQENKKIESDVAVVHGILNKRECKFSALSAIGYSRTRGVVAVGLDPRDQPGNDKTKNRDTGIQEFGPWYLTMTPRDDVWGVDFEAAHKCTKFGISWTTYTKLGNTVLMGQIKKIRAAP